jgi:hypothetical protein
MRRKIRKGRYEIGREGKEDLGNSRKMRKIWEYEKNQIRR